MGSPKPPSHGCAGQWSTFEAKPPPVGLDHNTHCTTQLKMCSALGYLSQALLTSSNSVVHLFKKNYYVLSTKENHVRAIYYVSKGLSVCTRQQRKRSLVSTPSSLQINSLSIRTWWNNFSVDHQYLFEYFKLTFQESIATFVYDIV